MNARRGRRQPSDPQQGAGAGAPAHNQLLHDRALTGDEEGSVAQPTTEQHLNVIERRSRARLIGMNTANTGAGLGV